MSEPRHRNFDQLWAEETAPGPRMTLFGETVQLPTGLPVAVRLLMVRRAADNSSFAWESVVEYAQLIVGVDTVDRWLERGITEDQLIAVVRYLVYEAYADDDEETEPTEGDVGEGEAPAPVLAGATR